MSIKLKILKTWVSKDFTIIFQAQPMAPKDWNVPKKIHLLIDLRQQTFGLRIDTDKPSQATANHAFIQILRKHIPSFTIKDILRDKATGDLYVPLLFGAPADRYWSIKLANSKPPLASLVDPDRTVHVSYGQKGTFTKKHALESYPDFAELESVYEATTAALNQAQSETDEEDADGLTPDAPASVEGAGQPIPEDQRELSGRLKRKLKTTRKNLEKLRTDLPSRPKVEEARQLAIHLQRYAYLVGGEAFELKLDASQTATGQSMHIELDPELSVGRNIEAAYERSRKLERKWKMVGEQLEQFTRHEQELLDDIEALRAEPQPESFWRQLIAKYKLPEITLTGKSAVSGGTPSAKPYKTYIGSSGHVMLVGKGARENDVLTKAARTNDYWFHAVGVTGSHVIVPCTPDLRSSLPSHVIKEAAILALHSSRLKDDRAGECYIARRAHLKKQKGMAAGLWKIDKSETVFIRYQDDELQKILQSIKA